MPGSSRLGWTQGRGLVRHNAKTTSQTSRQPKRIPDDVVYQIRQALKYSSATRTELARRFNVSRMAIWRIAKRRKVVLGVGRCPTCGGVVWFPCRKCELIQEGT